jgi:serpin B
MKYSILKHFYLLLFLLLLAPILWSCRKNSEILPTSPVPISLTLKQANLVTSENTFAFDIFGKVNEASANDNTVISPLSVSYALSMTVNGAANATRDSILKALRVSDMSTDDLNNSYKDLTSALLSVDTRVIMEIANSVWAEKTFPVKKTFSDILSDYYSAEARSFDITDPTAPQEMNSWISDHTNGLIKNMIDRLEDNTVMLLINAIYFKGKWKVQFKATETTLRAFTKPDGSTVDVQTMQQSEKHKVYIGDGFKIAELPYGQGNFVMDIILPDNNDLTQVSNLLNTSNFDSWTASLTERKVNLYFPRFKYGYKKELTDILKQMGMGIAFTDTADFSNISDWQLLLNLVLHQAFIETNEEGTEAAAATIVGFGTTSVGPDDPVTFDINHQFVYIIREVTTNSILFMGRIINPMAQ